MHNTTASELKPTVIRIGVLTASAAVSVLALGFAPIPQLFTWLGLSVLASLITLFTGPKGSKTALTLPIAALIVVPALCTLLVRSTSLIWVVAPVLAFVVGAVTWMVATTRYATAEATEYDTAATNGTVTMTVSDELQPKRDEKAAAADEDASATAA